MEDYKGTEGADLDPLYRYHESDGPTVEPPTVIPKIFNAVLLNSHRMENLKN